MIDQLYDYRRKAIYHLNKRLHRRPTSHPFISGDTFRALADIQIDTVDDLNNLFDCQTTTIIFCVTDLVDKFINIGLKKIKNKFILITHNSDHSVHNEVEELLDSDCLVHWFAQNNTINHQKITSIPIGLENLSYYNNGRPDEFIKYRSIAKNQQNRILCGFSIHTNVVERTMAQQALRAFELSDFLKTSARDYKKLLASYRFVASPPGNGPDCHRTWEALYLGTIPIVIGKEFYQRFTDFPGIVLDRWEELLEFNERDLHEAYAIHTTRLESAAYIWMPYWEKIISGLKNQNR